MAPISVSSIHLISTGWIIASEMGTQWRSQEILTGEADFAIV